MQGTGKGSCVRLRSGVDNALEEQANELIRQSLRGVTRHSAKSDILTPWKEQERHRREVYSHEGVVDPQVRRGMFHREANLAQPELNSRDGATPPRRMTSSLATFVREHGESSD